MQITKNDLGKNQIELLIELTADEVEPHLKTAANKLSQTSQIPGFRPGKAPYETVKNRFGEMAILQHALDDIIGQSFFEAVNQEKLITVGRPDINIEKMAPGNPLTYKAKVALLPKITLGAWKELKIAKEEIKVEAADIDKTLKQLQELNAQEKPVDRPAQNNDKVELDFEVLIDKVVIEGGKNYKYPIILGEERMIPGFEEQILGLKNGDTKEFELKFPDKYFQKKLAGKLATFKVKVVQVYERNLPELNDDLAKKFAFDDLNKLKEQIKNNIEQDKAKRAQQKNENEAIKAIIAQSQIEDIPEFLVDNEIHKMIHELEGDLEQQGLDMAGYLKSINKTHDDLHKDFETPALERVKAALALRQIAQEEKTEVSPEELKAEIAKEELMYKDHPEALENMRLPQYQEYLRNALVNQKVMKLISDTIIK